MSTDLSPDQRATAPVRKFLFERSFDGDLGLDFDERERPKPTFTEEQLEEAKRQAFEEGRLAGHREADENENKIQSALLATIGTKMAGMVDESAATWERQLASLMDVAFVIARKAIPVYAEKNGMAEIEAIVNRVIAEMGREPRLVIRIPEKMFDFLDPRITDIAEKRAFPGKVIVLGDPDMGPSDCRVEWADGGIERDFNALWQEIDQIMQSLTGAPQKEDATLSIPLTAQPDSGDAQ